MRKTLPYLHGRSPIEYMIEQRKGYDAALSITDGLATQAEEELARLTAENAWLKAVSQSAVKQTARYFYNKGQMRINEIEFLSHFNSVLDAHLAAALAPQLDAKIGE